MDRNQRIFPTDGELPASKGHGIPLTEISSTPNNNQVRHKPSFILRVDSSFLLHVNSSSNLFESPNRHTNDRNQRIFSTDGEVSYDLRAPLAEISSTTNIPAKPLRRKSSFGTRIDSSEDMPSPHASIFEAICTSPIDNSDEGDGERNFDDDNQDDDSNGFDFRYGRGTALDTITEQSSFQTLIYAAPLAPIQEPLERPPTPEDAVLPASLPPPPKPPSLYRRIFRARKIDISAQPAPQPLRPAPQFRPPRTVYPHIGQHPFNTAPLAKVRSKVRFTPSATARDSETAALRSAIESTSGAATHPLVPVMSGANPALPSEGSWWKTQVERFLFCCFGCES